MAPPFLGAFLRQWSFAFFAIYVCAAYLWQSASAESDEQPAQAPCVDDNAKWEVYNSTCTQMKWLCDSEGYGVLVRKWCPRSCGLCPDTDGTATEGNDFIALLAPMPAEVQRGVPFGLSVTRKGTENTTSKATLDGIDKSTEGVLRSQPGASSSNVTRSGNASQENQTNATSVAHVVQLPSGTQWEVSFPVKDALVQALSKSTLVPKGMWWDDQEHFIIEMGNGSRNSSDNVSADAADGHQAGSQQALQNDEENGCPPGYEQVDGHVYGGDQFGRGYNLFATSIRECAKWCSNTPGCGSFDYSRPQKRCFRNSQTRPTHLLNRNNYLFCRRAPCPSLLTEALCLGVAQSVAPGWYSKEVKMRPGSYCIWSAGKCQAPMACTHEDCFLPDGGLPGMELPPSKTLWISRAGLMSTMAKTPIIQLG